MQIVVTHRNADFDALASQAAVKKLAPDTVMVRAGALGRAVRDFLALHKEHFELTPVQEIPFDAVECLTVVDVRRAGRLSDFAPLLERARHSPSSLAVRIYDHHHEASDDLRGDFEQVEPVGATTTLLVERLLKQGVPIDPLEATLFALGIYSDTGSLTYPSTTARDAQAAADLVARGASLKTLRFFLHAPMNAAQRQALIGLLRDTDVVDAGGVKIGVAVLSLPEPVSGLSDLLNEAVTCEGLEALFAIFACRGRVSMVGRSQVPYVDVGNVMQAFGGGGHVGAGAASVKGLTAAEAKAALLEHIAQHPPRPVLVRDLMSTPVHTVGVRQPLQQVRRDFEARNISGSPVLRQGKLVGVISRRDIRAAARRGCAHLAVDSCMSQKVRTIEPGAPLVRALEEMMTADVGRLPVVEEGHIVGIVTRTDVLRVLYPRGDRPRRPAVA